MPLLESARVRDKDRQAITAVASSLVARLRSKGQRGGIDSLVSEYSLSSKEGIALMCLAEALLRIPDPATRDALIRDKIALGDWRAHIGEDRSIFVNAATWGLVVSGKLVTTTRETSLAKALSGLIQRAGEPVIRSAVQLAIELMGEQFVLGETIEQALKRATYSYIEGGASYFISMPPGQPNNTDVPVQNDEIGFSDREHQE